MPLQVPWSLEQRTLSHTMLEEVEDTYVPRFINVTIFTDKDIILIKETFSIAKKKQ